MKIALLSDIHGNLPALEATVEDIDRWRPDIVIVNGDIVNRGPESLACWQFVNWRRQRDGWLITRGNHEDYVIRNLEPPLEPHPMSWWVFQQLGPSAVRELAKLPLQERVYAPDGSECRAVHASMVHPRVGIWPDSPAAEAREQIAPAPAVFGCGHIHASFIRYLDQTVIVNSGSVGSISEYLGVYATYAQVTWVDGRWSADIVRLPYDYLAVDAAYKRTNALVDGGAEMRVVYYEWRTGWPLMPLWSKPERWKQLRAIVGEQAAIDQFLYEMNILDIYRPGW